MNDLPTYCRHWLVSSWNLLNSMNCSILYFQETMMDYCDHYQSFLYEDDDGSLPLKLGHIQQHLDDLLHIYFLFEALFDYWSTHLNQS